MNVLFINDDGDSKSGNGQFKPYILWNLLPLLVILFPINTIPIIKWTTFIILIIVVLIVNGIISKGNNEFKLWILNTLILTILCIILGVIFIGIGVLLAFSSLYFLNFLAVIIFIFGLISPILLFILFNIFLARDINVLTIKKYLKSGYKPQNDDEINLYITTIIENRKTFPLLFIKK